MLRQLAPQFVDPLRRGAIMDDIQNQDCALAICERLGPGYVQIYW
jgi:hypothetical protein